MKKKEQQISLLRFHPQTQKTQTKAEKNKKLNTHTHTHTHTHTLSVCLSPIHSIHIKSLLFPSSLLTAMEASSSSSHCSSSVTSPPPPPPPPPPLFNADLDKAPILVPSNPPTSTTSANPSDQIHVLAVDDSILDRKVIEKLLRTSSYKGIFFLSFSLTLKPLS